jgi:hypothetical protein
MAETKSVETEGRVVTFKRDDAGIQISIIGSIAMTARLTLEQFSYLVAPQKWKAGVPQVVSGEPPSRKV